ncbi:hypothetical protein AMAG_06274 [Allomyces macrogynus ATCC 38327]|uniref:Uncharacterized protein n=1 Tax=Allomyces macrogynus (strain ATCC 38327) TaxID=578462 RepID=A0A0L0SGE5_ALLM3|nr:hypothetical protein AMAG_06274 [Allomyces macrogynus ATCC 38327]|eukprot:KNE61450.1 hypothetical protein AMAG_06274 [Allomyces macrogynus ATCC 38327]
MVAFPGLRTTGAFLRFPTRSWAPPPPRPHPSLFTKIAGMTHCTLTPRSVTLAPNDVVRWPSTIITTAATINATRASTIKPWTRHFHWSLPCSRSSAPDVASSPRRASRAADAALPESPHSSDAPLRPWDSVEPWLLTSTAVRAPEFWDPLLERAEDHEPVIDPESAPAVVNDNDPVLLDDDAVAHDNSVLLDVSFLHGDILQAADAAAVERSPPSDARRTPSFLHTGWTKRSTAPPRVDASAVDCSAYAVGTSRQNRARAQLEPPRTDCDRPRTTPHRRMPFASVSPCRDAHLSTNPRLHDARTSIPHTMRDLRVRLFQLRQLARAALRRTRPILKRRANWTRAWELERAGKPWAAIVGERLPPAAGDALRQLNALVDAAVTPGVLQHCDAADVQSLMHACVLVRKWRTLDVLWARLVSTSPSGVDVHALNMAMTSHAARGDADAAVALLDARIATARATKQPVDRVSALGIDAHSVAIAVAALARAGRFVDALHVFDRCCRDADADVREVPVGRGPPGFAPGVVPDMYLVHLTAAVVAEVQEVVARKKRRDEKARKAAGGKRNGGGARRKE